MTDFEQFHYRVRVGTVISQAVNTLLLGGHPDMSLSTRAHLKGGWVEDLIDTLFGDGHCLSAYRADRRFAKAMLDTNDGLIN